MTDDMLDSLAEARSKIEATRRALEAASDPPDGELAVLVAQLDRMAAEVESVEETLRDREMAKSRVRSRQALELKA